MLYYNKSENMILMKRKKSTGIVVFDQSEQFCLRISIKSSRALHTSKYYTKVLIIAKLLDHGFWTTVRSRKARSAVIMQMVVGGTESAFSSHAIVVIVGCQIRIIYKCFYLTGIIPPKFIAEIRIIHNV